MFLSDAGCQVNVRIFDDSVCVCGRQVLVMSRPSLVGGRACVQFIPDGFVVWFDVGDGQTAGQDHAYI